MKRLFRILTVFLLFGLLGAGTVGFIFFYPNVNANLSGTTFDIPKDATCEQVLDSLTSRQILKNPTTFKVAARILKYERMRCGHYELRPGENNYRFVRRLRAGQHHTLKFTFNNVRTKEQFVEKTEGKFFFAANDLYNLLVDSNFLKKYDLNLETCTGIFIPNTYEFFYDISAEEFFEKMYQNYVDFWNASRRQKAEAIGLSPMEVVILASIVEEENHRNEEKPIIAGLYLNRLQKGMLLQADPTVKFALGDFTLTRVLNSHLEVDSPYNTYRYAGLPPGPIRMPEISSIDAVLNYQHHHYLYMCAKEDFSGYHNFAVTSAEHARNAARYRAALSRWQKARK